jgi:FG-GAP-like repeat
VKRLLDETSTVSVLVNRGDGSFDPRRDFETRGGPDAVVIADLNGDGAPDLATADGVTSAVSVLLNRGGGRFERAGDYEVGGGFPSFAVGDLNGDGKPDLVAAGADWLYVLMNSGGGTFGPRRAYPARGRAAIGDLNGDGKPDLATSSVSVLLNRGGGSFELGVDFPEGTSIAIGDVNGDGRPDLVTVDGEAGEPGSSVSVRINTPGLCNVQEVRSDFRPIGLAPARRILARGHCRVGKVRRRFDKYVKKGRVISQRPLFGAVLPGGGKVNLVVSRGKRLS